MSGPTYALRLTQKQLDELKSILERASMSEADPEAEVFVILDLVRAARVDAMREFRLEQADAEPVGSTCDRPQPGPLGRWY